MRALTVKTPWAWAIARGGKDVENRTWQPRMLARPAGCIHAGALSGWDKAGEESPCVNLAWPALHGTALDTEPLDGHARTLSRPHTAALISSSAVVPVAEVERMPLRRQLRPVRCVSLKERAEPARRGPLAVSGTGISPTTARSLGRSPARARLACGVSPRTRAGRDGATGRPHAHPVGGVADA